MSESNGGRLHTGEAQIPVVHEAGHFSSLSLTLKTLRIPKDSVHIGRLEKLAVVSRKKVGADHGINALDGQKQRMFLGETLQLICGHKISRSKTSPVIVGGFCG